MNEPGTISIGENDTVLIEVEGESYRIAPEDAKALIFQGRVVPVVQARRKIRPGGGQTQALSIEGHAAMNRAGKAVLIFTRAGYYIIPFMSFRKVADGEVVSAPLFPLRPDTDGGMV